MDVYLCPTYVSLRSIEVYSPKLFKLLEKRGVVLAPKQWEGTLADLPTDGPAIIRASSKMYCSVEELAKRATELGLFVFYDDAVLLESGKYDKASLTDEANAFLDRVAAM